MDERKISELTDEELVERTGSVAIGTPSGMRAQEAQAELTRRLTESMRAMDKTTEHYSFRLLGLTVLLLVATVVLIVLTAIMLPLPWVGRAFIALGSIALLGWGMFDWFRSEKRVK